MEKGQNFGYADELHERRKKKGALPLAVFLTFNDRDVNPQCPNACNPYHKCGWYCLDKLPYGNKFLYGERSGGSSSDCEKMSEIKGVNPSCPNASNPFHKCAEYCFEKFTGKRQDADKEPGKNKGVLKAGDESAVNPNCKYASNPYHRCNKFCFENSPVNNHRKDVMKPNEQKLVRTADRAVNSECKYASNPYHVCNEYCFQKVPERIQPGQAMNLKNLKERKKIDNNTERTGVDPHCRYSSNPYHKCSEFCFQNLAKRDIPDGVTKSKEGKKAVRDVERRDGKPKCANASNPFHKCTENCFQEIPRDNPAMEGLIKEKNGRQLKERKANHPMTEKSLESDYTDSSKGITIHVGTNESESVLIKEEKEASMIELLDSQPLRIDVCDLFKEWAKYCSLNATEDNEAKTGKTGQRKEQRTRRDEEG